MNAVVRRLAVGPTGQCLNLPGIRTRNLLMAVFKLRMPVYRVATMRFLTVRNSKGSYFSNTTSHLTDFTTMIFLMLTTRYLDALVTVEEKSYNGIHIMQFMCAKSLF